MVSKAGTLFLLNLLDSLEVGIVDKIQVKKYFARLLAVPLVDRHREGWWWRCQPLWGLSDVAHPLQEAPTSSLVGARWLPVRRLETCGLGVLNYESSRTIVDQEEIRILVAELFPRNKNWYWFSSVAAINNSILPSQAREKLGLDWLSADYACFSVEIAMADAGDCGGAFRPTGLCGGSMRFRARREDENGHLSYPSWGMTVDLAAWKQRKEKISGVPEALLALSERSIIELSRINCHGILRDIVSPNDHAEFAVLLNGGCSLDVDVLFDRLDSALG